MDNGDGIEEEHISTAENMLHIFRPDGLHNEETIDCTQEATVDQTDNLAPKKPLCLKPISRQHWYVSWRSYMTMFSRDHSGHQFLCRTC